MLKKDFINGWTQVPNQIINHKQLSFKAKGLWMYINSKPESWDFAVWRITKETREGEKAIRAGLNELVQHGYLEYQPKYDKEKKQFIGQDYILYDNPKQCTPKPEYTETSVSQNGVHYNNKELNKTELVKKSEDTPQKKIWELLEKLKIPTEDPIAYQIYNSIISKIPVDTMDDYFDYLIRNKSNHKDKYKPIALTNWFYQDYLADRASKTVREETESEIKQETNEVLQEYDTWKPPTQDLTDLLKKARNSIKKV